MAKVPRGVLAAFVLLVAGGVLVYPVVRNYRLRREVYANAAEAREYDPSWPIGEDDYNEARRAVESMLTGEQVIHWVSVVSDSEIRFGILDYWHGPLSAAGHDLVARKSGGRWTITKGHTHWVS